MNKEAQARFDEILKIDPRNLNQEQKAFLRARRSYLKKSQEEEYKEVLEQEEVAEQNENFLTYPQLLAKAKELGYKGGRVKRPVLEQFIAEKTDNNPFN